MEPLPRWVALTVIFVLTVAVMACIGHGVARAFVQFEALEAYRLDILGSIGGIVVFSVLAFLQLPPIVWGVDRRRAARRAARVATAAARPPRGRGRARRSSRPRRTTTGRRTTRSRPSRAATADRRRHRGPRHADHLGQQHPAPDRLRGRRRCSTSSRSTPSRTGTSTRLARPGPHRRRRQRQRRRGRAGPRRQARRRGRDRPGHPDARVEVPPEPPVPGPAGDGPHRRRPGLRRARRTASTT